MTKGDTRETFASRSDSSHSEKIISYNASFLLWRIKLPLSIALLILSNGSMVTYGLSINETTSLPTTSSSSFGVESNTTPSDPVSGGLDVNTTTSNKDSKGADVLRDCKKKSPCSCLSSELGLVDLSPLASTTNPRFQNVVGKAGNQFFFWNPCSSFSIPGTPCNKVAVCEEVRYATSSFHNLGRQDTAKFKVDSSKDGSLTLSYYANTFRPNDDKLNRTEHTFLRSSHFKLVCDVTKSPGTLQAHGENPEKIEEYHFTLTSVYACPEKMRPTQKSTGSTLSVGTWILIGCAIAIASYILIGTLVQVVVRKQTGLDAIPNRSLWVAISGLVKGIRLLELYRDFLGGFEPRPRHLVMGFGNTSDHPFPRPDGGQSLRTPELDGFLFLTGRGSRSGYSEL